jgi:hypothetical protein
MKEFIAVLILIFSFQSWTKADDISDFEIEGMSIGDSLLNHFSKSEIENNKVFEVEQKNNKEVSRYYIYKNTGNYEYITASFKTNDKQYKIIELSGFINLSFKDCKKKRKNIDKELKLLFGNLEREKSGDLKHQLDKSSKVNHIVYWFNNNEYISLTCYDWSKKSGHEDQLRLEIYNSEYMEWLRSLGS